ncbi:MAG: efflux RND transporter periplasmic adaptor subunit [Gammaproteobacteria bacterium]
MIAWTVAAALAMAALVAAFAWYQFQYAPARAAERLAAARRAPVTISTAVAQALSWQPELSAVATLAAERGTAIAPEVDGVVTAIHFESGQELPAGAPLVQLDDRVLQAQLREAEAELANAGVEFERASDLARRGSLSRSALDAARARLDRARAARATTQALIDQRLVRAPFAGRAGVRRVQLGEYVEAGKPIVGLQNVRPMHADFALPEQALRRIEVGQRVQAAVDGGAEGAEGAISAIDSAIDPDTRTFLVRATFANADGRLAPGQYADVTVRAGAPRRVVAVPQSAIAYSLAGDTLFAVKPGADGVAVAEQRIVRTGERRADMVEIVSGVTAGEQVVSLGQFKLRNGVPVRVDNSLVLAAPAERPRH